MPYIKQEDRAILNPAIDELGKLICKITSEAEIPELAFGGLLNYSLTRTVLYVIKNQFGEKGIRYWIVAMASGVLHNVADEFYRRLASPYEDKQIRVNGDVDLYDELIKDSGLKETYAVLD